MDFDRNRVGQFLLLYGLTFSAALFALADFVSKENAGRFFALFVGYLAVGLGAAFALHLWAKGQARREVAGTAPFDERGIKELSKVAGPSLEIPTALDPVHARALVSGKLDSTTTQALVASAAARRALDVEWVKRSVRVASGTQFGVLPEIDQARLATLLASGPRPLELKRRTKPTIQASNAIADSCAAELRHTDYWAWGNPASDDITKWSRLVWTVAWTTMVFGVVLLFVFFQLGAVLIMAGFGMGIGYAVRSKAELPGLSPTGAQLAIEARSLQLGLRKITDEQVRELHTSGQLATFAAWAVILRAPKCVARINKLAKKNSDDPTIADARAVAALGQPPATYALGAVDPLIGVVFFAPIFIWAMIWFRRYRIGDRPLAAFVPAAAPSMPPPSAPPVWTEPSM